MAATVSGRTADAVALQAAITSVPRSTCAMPVHWSLIVDLVAAFLFAHSQKALVPLLQTCRHFAPWLTKVLDHLDNTLRVAEGCQGAWAVGNSQVTFHVRTGRRARRAVQRGVAQSLDLPFLAQLGFFPDELLDTLQIPGTFFWLWRSVRYYETAHGHLHVEEMEGLVQYTGYLHVFWVLQITTHHDAPLPRDVETMSVEAYTPTASRQESRKQVLRGGVHRFFVGRQPLVLLQLTKIDFETVGHVNALSLCNLILPGCENKLKSHFWFLNSSAQQSQTQRAESEDFRTKAVWSFEAPKSLMGKKARRLCSFVASCRRCRSSIRFDNIKHRRGITASPIDVALTAKVVQTLAPCEQNLIAMNISGGFQPGTTKCKWAYGVDEFVSFVDRLTQNGMALLNALKCKHHV